MAVDAQGNVYVLDYTNRVQKFSATGAFLTAWGSTGSANGQFSTPRGITVDDTGLVYVVDSYFRVQVFTGSGAYVGKFGTYGLGAGQFLGATDVAVDATGRVYVVDNALSRVTVFQRED